MNRKKLFRILAPLLCIVITAVPIIIRQVKSDNSGITGTWYTYDILDENLKSCLSDYEDECSYTLKFRKNGSFTISLNGNETEGIYKAADSADGSENSEYLLSYGLNLNISTRYSKSENLLYVYFSDDFILVLSDSMNDLSEKIAAEKENEPESSETEVESEASTVSFGTYEQDNDTSDGAEPIEWTVLDKQDGKMLLVSTYAIDAKPYNKNNENVTWESSSLRAWLNDEFISEAFTGEEAERILSVELSADASPDYDTDAGNSTEDKVFLLSLSEVEKYYGEKDSKLRTQATTYACSSASGFNVSGINVYADWWLRTPGESGSYAAFVNASGYTNSLGNTVSNTAYVRPAIWVTVE